MRELAPFQIPEMTPAAIMRVRNLEEVLLVRNPDGNLPIQHVLHAGLYARTVCVPAGLVITGALVKIPTLLIVQGDCFVTLGAEVRRIAGYQVIPAAAGRKQAFRTVADTHITMVFPTDARTVEEAERQFSDEYERLASRKDNAVNETICTGERV